MGEYVEPCPEHRGRILGNWETICERKTMTMLDGGAIVRPHVLRVRRILDTEEDQGWANT